MAYDLVVGKGNKVKDSPDLVGSIEFSLYPVITSLQRKHPIPMLNQLCDQFSDHTFDKTQLVLAKNQLFHIMASGDLTEQELALIYQLISATCYALDKGYLLYGIAD